MSRRPDPKRIDEARRGAVRNVLIEEDRMSATVADAWIRDWDAEAGRLGVERGSEYWTLCLAWIHERTRR